MSGIGDPHRIRRILVIKVARIGDTLFVTPVIRALREAFPHAKIHVIAHPKRMCVLFNNPDIDVLWGWGLWNRLVHFPRMGAYFDLVLVYGEDGRLLKLARKVGGLTVGFEQRDGALNRYLDLPVRKADTPLHAVDDRLQLLRAIGIPSRGKKLVYRVSREEGEWARAFMERYGDTLRIGFQVGGYPTKAYRDWPADHYVSLGRAILEDLKARIFLFGDRKDRRKAEYIRDGLGGRAVVLAGSTDLRKTGALISLCHAFVTTDTGPMHIAFALDVPTVAIFHCMHPGRLLGPVEDGGRHRVIQMEPPPGVECSRSLTMESVGSGEVWEALKDLLRGEGLI